MRVTVGDLSRKVRSRKKVIDRGKRSKTLHEVNPIENINKYPQSFLEICTSRAKGSPSFTQTARLCL